MFACKVGFRAEPNILCLWAPVWSTWVPNVDQMGAHGHKMYGSSFEFLLSLQLELVKSYVTLNKPIKSIQFIHPNLKRRMVSIHGQIQKLYEPCQVQNHNSCIYGFENYFKHFLTSKMTQRARERNYVVASKGIHAT